MDRKRIELIAVIVLAVVFLTLLFSTFKKRPAGKPVAIKPKTESIKAALQKEIIQKEERFIPQESKRPGLSRSLGRDPFVIASLGAGGESGISAVELGGILGHKNGRKAVINNEIVGVGDKVGNIEIVDIKENSVVIKQAGSTREIKLE